MCLAFVSVLNAGLPVLAPSFPFDFGAWIRTVILTPVQVCQRQTGNRK